MAGIKETKELLKFIVEFAEAIDKSMEDGDIGFADLTNLVSAMMAAGDAFSDISLIPEEINDLDDNEALELYAYAKDELDLRSDKLEEIVESALEIGLKVYQLFNLIKGTAPTPAAPAA